MKILIIAPSNLPLPATKGGAVETGIDQIIEENEKNNNTYIEIFSYYNESAKQKSKKYIKTSFNYYYPHFYDKIALYIIKSINKFNKILHIKKEYNTRPFFIKYVSNKIKNKKYDGILIKNAIRYVPIIHKCNSSPIILQLHNDFLNSSVPNNNEIARFASKIISNSLYIKKRIETIDNIDNNKLYVNMNCLDNNSFIIPSHSKQQELIKKYNIDTNKKNIIYVGRIVKQKGIKELLLALNLIQENKNWHLLIVGGKWFSNNNKNSYYKELEKISSDFKERISFLGYINHNDIKNLYYLSSLAVVPSIWEEPAGRVVLEAEAMGLPLIVSNSGGIPEYTNKNSSIIINKNNQFINNMAKSIDYLLKNEKISKSMGLNGIKYASNFTSERYYKEIISIIGDTKNE